MGTRLSPKSQRLPSKNLLNLAYAQTGDAVCLTRRRKLSADVGRREHKRPSAAMRLWVPFAQRTVGLTAGRLHVGRLRRQLRRRDHSGDRRDGVRTARRMLMRGRPNVAMALV